LKFGASPEKLFMNKKCLLFVFLCFSLLTASTSYAIVPVNTEPVPQTMVDRAVSEFNDLSKKEKKPRLKEVKKQLSLFKANKAKGMEADDRTILLVVLAIILPPLAVYLHQGAINTKFWISLLLTLLFWIPGVIYALLVVLGVV
jgi:uncharacterized membrane protein YqaE (UPF0057 family)